MRHWTPYLLVAPPVVLLASLVIYPLLYNVSLSLRSYGTGEFVGLHNFARALDDPQFFASLWATAISVSGTLVVEILLGLALALRVQRTLRSGWARVDGADGWRLFRHIEYPYLRSLLLLVMVFRFTDTFRVFDHVQVLTGGGPGATTEFLSLYLYLIAFKFFNLSYAAALSLFVLFVTSAAFSVLTRYLGREVSE